MIYVDYIETICCFLTKTTLGNVKKSKKGIPIYSPQIKTKKR